MLERLRAFEAKQGGEHPDWRTIGTVLYEAPLEWRRIGPVDRQALREVEAEFDAALTRLRGRLEAWQAQNAADKRVVIERARAMLEKADGREAVEGIKALQQQWRTIGPASRAEEGPLWNEFREQCDGVFRKREQAYAEHAASLEGHKAQALALCEEMEELAAQSGVSLLEAAKEMPKRRAAFEALGELPRPEARALYTRFERALNACENKVRTQRAQDAAQVFENLIEATLRIHAYGWAVANNAEATEREGLKAEAESFIAGVSQWPKGGAAALKDAWAKAEAAVRHGPGAERNGTQNPVHTRGDCDRAAHPGRGPAPAPKLPAATSGAGHGTAPGADRPGLGGPGTRVGGRGARVPRDARQLSWPVSASCEPKRGAWSMAGRGGPQRWAQTREAQMTE